MNENAKAGYDIALRLTDKTARTVWSVYACLLATNGFLVSLAAFLNGRSQIEPIVLRSIGGLGLLICLAWSLITFRNFDFYRYYFACARKLEEDAFGAEVQVVRQGAEFARGAACNVGASPQRMRWGSRLFRVEYLIHLVIGTFAIIYGYLLCS